MRRSESRSCYLSSLRDLPVLGFSFLGLAFLKGLGWIDLNWFPVVPDHRMTRWTDQPSAGVKQKIASSCENVFTVTLNNKER